MVRRAVIAVLAGSFVAVAAYAIIVPYDFTGHWTGTAHRPEKPDVAMLAADLTTTTPPMFTGTVTVVLTEETDDPPALDESTLCWCAGAPSPCRCDAAGKCNECGWCRDHCRCFHAA